MSMAQMVVRMPAEVRDWLENAAKKDDRSMNGFIVTMLKRAMASQSQKENAPAVGAAGASD